ncbi:class I SAM-dependent rRNA methyltransferase [soil metagenome]
MRWIGPEQVGAFAEAGTDAYRIASGRDARIERFGDGAIISYTNELSALSGALLSWCEKTKTAIARVYARRLVVGPGKDNAPQLLEEYSTAGAQPDGVAMENHLRYAIDFLAGYSCGLFVDQRENRVHLRGLNPRKVLNTFAYTCAFSVAAAASGAETVSVDLAKASLERGKANFQLNGLSLDGHRFLTDDVLDVLPRLARRGDKFDAIILDPPTFSRSRAGRVFRVEKDFGILLERAVDVAAPGAGILLSTNCSALQSDDLCAIARRHLRGSISFSNALAQPDIPSGQGASTVWLRLG